MHALPLALLATFSLAAALPAQTQFVDVTSASGITAVHDPVPNHPMATMVGGAGVADFNRDGWPDVYAITGGAGPDKLYINNGDGTFSDQAAAWGLSEEIMTGGVSAADYDNDGWVDLHLTCFGPAGQPAPGQNRLFRNNGNGTFTDVAAQAGLQWSSLEADCFGAAWGDYDLDGWLDLFVASYQPGTSGNRLYHNNRDGTFTDKTRQAGIQADLVRGFVPTFADMDGDRYPELILIADSGSSQYYINNRDGSFTDSTHTVQRLNIPNGMGCAIADIDQNGLLDFYVSGSYDPIIQARGNMLYMNQGDHVYTEEAQSYLVHDCGWGWGTMAIDFDNDGLMDLGGTNGFPGPYLNIPTKLFHNQGNGTFSEVAQTVGIDHRVQGRTMAQLDYDRDGDHDILLSGFNAELKLFRNDLNNGNSWLRVALDTSAHGGLAPSGIGTQIEATIGSVEQVHLVSGGQSYLGQPEVTAHLGLGSAAVVDELRIRWRDGFTTRLHNVAAGQELLVRALPPLGQSTLQRGQPATTTVTGAEPGEVVHFLYSLAGPGNGPPVPVLGGLELDLRMPIVDAAVVTADAAGVATWNTTLSSKAPVAPVATQAVIRRGPGGIDSVKTNVLTSVILP